MKNKLLLAAISCALLFSGNCFGMKKRAVPKYIKDLENILSDLAFDKENQDEAARKIASALTYLVKKGCARIDDRGGYRVICLDRMMTHLVSTLEEKFATYSQEEVASVLSKTADIIQEEVPWYNVDDKMGFNLRLDILKAMCRDYGFCDVEFKKIEVQESRCKNYFLVSCCAVLTAFVAVFYLASK